MKTYIASCEGKFVKCIPITQGEQVYGFHEAFGFISEDALRERLASLKRRGSLGRDKSWLFRLRFKSEGSITTLYPLENCTVQKKDGSWFVEGAGRSMALSSNMDNVSVPWISDADSAEDKGRLILGIAFLVFLLMSTALILWEPAEAPKVEEVPEEVTVVIKKQPTVKVTAASKILKERKVAPEVKRAVNQELGLLGLVGKKNLKKATGGAQLDLSASPGAGKGGNAGSGGEVLSGLGRGVRATTVGNTGVQGLGGIGTKGVGGGGGGYGDVEIASGEGKGISAISVSQGVGIDGGLDRHVIQATIAKYLSQVRACYEDRLRQNPGLQGTLAMNFEIGASGKLNFSKVKSSSLTDPAVGNCVAQKMMGWEFPKPRGGLNVLVNYPFALRPVGR